MKNIIGKVRLMVQTPEPPPPAVHHCPWCHYTDPLLKKVMLHMEAKHRRRWEDLALFHRSRGMGRCTCVEGLRVSGFSPERLLTCHDLHCIPATAVPGHTG
jgi:hypothetical protein